MAMFINTIFATVTTSTDIIIQILNSVQGKGYHTYTVWKAPPNTLFILVGSTWPSPTNCMQVTFTPDAPTRPWPSMYYIDGERLSVLRKTLQLHTWYSWLNREIHSHINIHYEMQSPYSFFWVFKCKLRDSHINTFKVEFTLTSCSQENYVDFWTWRILRFIAQVSFFLSLFLHCIHDAVYCRPPVT